MSHPLRLLNILKENHPEFARVGAIDDSPIDSSVNDYRMSLDHENRNFKTGNISRMQICSCSWTKRTSIKGLRIHQGQMRCSRESKVGLCIGQYFLRMQSNQSCEVQQQEKNPKSGASEYQQGEPMQVLRQKINYSTTISLTRIQRAIDYAFRWPKSSNKAEWVEINTELCIYNEQTLENSWKEAWGDMEHNIWIWVRAVWSRVTKKENGSTQKVETATRNPSTC